MSVCVSPLKLHLFVVVVVFWVGFSQEIQPNTLCIRPCQRLQKLTPVKCLFLNLLQYFSSQLVQMSACVKSELPKMSFIAIELSLKVNPLFTLSLGLLSPPIPSFNGVWKVKTILIKPTLKWCNSSMKCRYSAFKAQDSRLIIVVVHVRSNENICSSNGGDQEKGKTGWNSAYHQNW